KPPPITIGTIHSVKGGEADVVYLYPDISVAAATERMIGAGQESEDSLLRLFYVGMTRAYEELVLMSPVLKRSGKNKVRVNFHMELS
ncbi:MAG TPA: ATP-binding domain-containing protein, partial [Alphaproteobacteria bacterium]|nr:ATP-binding domain-containing protein [Alphaproteobacteria bacterium]